MSFTFTPNSNVRPQLQKLGVAPAQKFWEAKSKPRPEAFSSGAYVSIPMNPLVGAIGAAYNQHRPLAPSPDWRKTLQEARIENELIRRGFTKSEYRGDAERASDIEVGTYSKERRVRGRTVQKADCVVRTKSGARLALIEAKAVGVELDAYKRVKECCDKAADWRTNERLGSLAVIAVVAGFLTETNLATLRAARIAVVWEHALEGLANALG